MMAWLDGRNNSSFGALSWSGNSLSFSVTQNSAANGLQALVPRVVNGVVVTGITRNGSPITFTTEIIKGVSYAVVSALSGAYVASFAPDTTPPTVVSHSPNTGATGVSQAALITATFSEDMGPATIGTSTFELRGPGNTLVTATVTYNGAIRTATLDPSASLLSSTSYTATVKGGATGAKDAGGLAMVSDFVWTFTTEAAPCSSSCSGWNNATTPTNAPANDPNAVELGVKFRSDSDGFITGIRFYKGAGNTGTHVGRLWTTGGTQLATATFTSETASGWQQVSFAAPVAITANTVYVASYHAPNGGYAFDSNYFAGSGFQNGPLYFLKDGESGGNGVYVYGAGGFPTNTFQASNYWVDVVFTTSAGGSDTTPPTVITKSPTDNATGVSPTTAVTVTFNEPLNPATVNTSTFELRDSTNALVTATVSSNANTATLTPSTVLANSATYTATLKGGATDPRVKDVADNALAANATWSFTTVGVGGVCGSPANGIVAENCLTGNAASEWDVNGAGNASIQGFATDISVNRGQTVSFKIDTNSSDYRLDIYRMGYYGGAGARKITTVQPSATLPQSQPACLNDSATGLIECGNWAVSASWSVPATATSGIYFAKAVREDGANAGQASHIVFVVRDDASTSNILFQTSDTTWQAYNNYGGNSLYTGSPAGRAYKVSYNRPFRTRAVDNGQDWLFNAEYPMVRWLEANGYDVSYSTGVDSDRRGALIRNHKLFLSVGHDEYWSDGQHTNVEAARNAGVDLGFFSGNEVFWKTRWENSIDGSGTPYRTLVCYKETHANEKIDPLPGVWTGTWRDPRFSPPADGGRPENALTGTLFTVNAGATTSIRVPAEDGKMRFWRNTSIANLAAGATATLPFGTLGYEWDEDIDNGFRPAGLFHMSTAVVPNAPVLLDYGSNFGSGTATHHLTLYRHNSGALVFGSGTVQWSWGLDSNHDNGSAAADVRMRQATVNLFADMGVQPSTLQSGLVHATASADATAPSSTIASPTNGSNVPQGSPVTISGTATDSGGGVVGGVEVSVDGGSTWFPANGRSNWSVTWLPSASGSVTIRSRAVDDSGNLETPSAGVNVTVGSGNPPSTCTGSSVWPATAVPANPADPDTTPVELGVKFRSDVSGFVCGIRFYKSGTNTGTHVGNLWSSSGTLLATATFTGETASGWQQADFATPVAVTANIVYVASYHAPNGRYAADTGFFAAGGVDNAPLHALQDGVSGGNGAYVYGTGGFPSITFQSTNYWVDVVFTTSTGPDTTPPTAPSNLSATAVSTSQINLTWTGSTDNVGVSGYRVERCQGAGCTDFAEVATPTGTSHADSGLTPGTTYRYRVRAADAVPNFSGYSNIATATTATSDTTPPTVSSSTTPANGATGVAVVATVTAIFSEAMDHPATVNTSTFELRDASNALVTATVSYNASTNTATLTPSSALSNGVTYTATVKGGTTDPRVKDLAGNALAVNVSWSFTTASSGACTGNTIWPGTAVPAVAADPDTSAVELGVKFRSDVNGTVCGVRFYKGSANTGTHVGKLWSSGGTLLAQAIFTGETASGWQQVNFTSPVAITAGTTYVASYHAPNGRYAVNEGYFTTGVDTPPLHALQDGVSGGNGVYLYGAGGFPTNTFAFSNYWVDVVFIPGTASTLASIAVTPANPTIQTSATQQFTATGTYSDSSTQNITTQVTWASSNTAVATINSAGLATAGTSTGTTSISATSGAASGNSTLTVQTAPPITSTGFLAPSANAAVTSGAGDNNWFQTTPSNAYVTNGLFAVDTNSGTNTNTTGARTSTATTTTTSLYRVA
ncbi:MAG: DUF4082 domain-containing protein [Pseudomonadota bacterium]|nr:DUF4082 domain-containing protein [Pseudomonadota bacterium]